MDIHNWIMYIHNCIHNWIVDIYYRQVSNIRRTLVGN